MLSNHTLHFAKKVWDYLLTNQTLEKADCILVLGSNDLRVAERGAELYLQGYAPLLIFSGGLGNFTLGKWNEQEADKFAAVALKMGVPLKDILVENMSTNTGENIVFTQRLLASLNIDPSSFIVVQKPYMERRSYATFKQHWPGKKLVVTSPQITFENYPLGEITIEHVINTMVGDLQRIKEYPAKGFQVYQEIPEDVWEAYNQLIAAGFNKHLMK